MKFTEDVIKSCRICAVFLDEPAFSVFNLALDEIERLQKENKELKEFVDATRPTGICEICTSNVISRYEPLQARVQELEQERRWIYQDKTMIVKKDGDSWCAVLPDFKDLQQSESRWFSGDINKYMDDVYWYLKRQTPTPEGGRMSEKSDYQKHLESMSEIEYKRLTQGDWSRNETDTRVHCTKDGEFPEDKETVFAEIHGQYFDGITHKLDFDKDNGLWIDYDGENIPHIPEEMTVYWQPLTSLKAQYELQGEVNR